MVNGTTRPPYRYRIQRIGRPNGSSPWPSFERRVPSHLLRERHAAQHAGQHLGQHIDRGVAALVLAHADVFALRRLDALDLIFGHALLLGEAGAGRRQRAVRAECRRHRRPGDELFEIGLPLGNLARPHRQAPRRAEGFDRLVDRQPRFLQPRLEHLAELRRQARQPAGRNLFGADLEEQFAIHSSRSRLPGLLAAPGSDGSCWPTYALQIASASWRTRRMYAMRSVTPTLPLESSRLNRCEHFRQCSSAGRIKPALQQLLAELVGLVEHVPMKRRDSARDRSRSAD